MADSPVSSGKALVCSTGLRAGLSWGQRPGSSHPVLTEKPEILHGSMRESPRTPLFLPPHCKAPCNHTHLPTLPAQSKGCFSLPITQPGVQAGAGIPLLVVFCWGTCRACLANEKLLWIPLWAFQEGLARFLQSRHGKTACSSKYIRDFSGAWLWQGLSAVVSQVVSLPGYTNRKVLSGIDMGLLGLSLSGVPTQIRPRLIASESCYCLTALQGSIRPHTHTNDVGCRKAFLQRQPTLLQPTPRLAAPRGGEQSPNDPLRSTEPPPHPPTCPHLLLMAREQKLHPNLLSSQHTASISTFHFCPDTKRTTAKQQSHRVELGLGVSSCSITSQGRSPGSMGTAAESVTGAAPTEVVCSSCSWPVFPTWSHWGR